MECYEVVTEEGEGFWGRTYQINLVLRRRQYTARFEPRQREIVDYGFYFKEPTAREWDRRLFESEAERSDFMGRGISNLQLTTLPAPQAVTTPGFLTGVVGQKLESVTFIWDYLQMFFERDHFNFYNSPVLYEGETASKPIDELYYHRLLSLVGKAVNRADEYLDIGLGFDFDNGILLSIPLRVDAGFSGPEIAECGTMIWSAGEAPFEL